MVALQCGLPTRRELYERLSYAELLELEGEYNREPWGEWRADLRAGIVAAAAVSPHLKRGSVARPIDYMPFEKKRSRGQTPKQQKAVMQSIADSMKRRKAKRG